MPESGFRPPANPVRGPWYTGYLNNEEATNQTIVDGGWLRTGDMASSTNTAPTSSTASRGSS